MDPLNKVMTCGTCAAFVFEHEQEGARNGRGSCHLKPPNRASGASRQPVVYKLDWCMEWVPDKQRLIDKIKEVMVTED
jgi:hypothetical protein